MCLDNCQKNVKNFLRYNKGKKYIWCYKEVDVYNDLVLTPFQKTKIKKAGWFKSDNTLKYPSFINGFIHNGIHVYTKSIIYIIEPKYYLKVKCYVKDLIGINYYKDEMVFQKIFIPSQELKRLKKLFN